MSSYIVNPETLERVVSSAATKLDSQLLGKHFEKLGYDLASEPDRLRLAEDLFALNVDAFCERYPGESGARTRYPEDVPEESGIDPRKLERDIHAIPNRDWLVQSFKTARCLLYQCAEGDISERPLYGALEDFASHLAKCVVRTLPEYDAANWG